EGDIAADHGDLEGTAGLRDARHRLLELPEDLGPLRGPEVEHVGQPQGPGAGDCQVPRRFGHRHCCAQARIQIDETGVAVGSYGYSLPSSLDTDRKSTRLNSSHP